MQTSMESYPKAAVERAMKVQEVILRAMARKITWWQAAANMPITLLDREALSTCGLHQPLAHALVEPGIGGKTNGLGLSVVSMLTRFNSAGRITRIFMPASIGPRSICSAPASPSRLRQRVILEGSIGIRMLKMPHAAEVLPVRIFHPQGNHVFIAQVMPILQIVQSHHQTRRDAGRTMTGMIGAAQGLFERLPVDRKTETNQGMAPVDQLLPIYLKQLPLWLLRLALGLHCFSPVSKTFAAASGKF